VLYPVAQQEGIIFVEVAIVENQQEFAAVRVEPWIECGIPPGKYQRSPTADSSPKVCPWGSMAVIRALP